MVVGHDAPALVEHEARPGRGPRPHLDHARQDGGRCRGGGADGRRRRTAAPPGELGSCLLRGVLAQRDPVRGARPREAAREHRDQHEGGDEAPAPALPRGVGGGRSPRWGAVARAARRVSRAARAAWLPEQEHRVHRLRVRLLRCRARSGLSKSGPAGRPRPGQLGGVRAVMATSFRQGSRANQRIEHGAAARHEDQAEAARPGVSSCAPVRYPTELPMSS